MTSAGAGRFEWDLPAGFPAPKIPDDNSMTSAKVELGRHIFYDTRLSVNGSQSCASCHDQSKAFTDGKARGVGATGETHPRGSMSLANIVYQPVLTWGNPNMKRLEKQALAPMFGEHPVELGLAGKEKDLLAKLKAESRYRRLFPLAFAGESDPFTLENITRAIAAFERTLISGDSPYDRYLNGDRRAITASAKRGEALFYSERLECFHCHGGFNFSQSEDHAGKAFAEIEFHNTGLYNLGDSGAYPKDNTGVFEFTTRPEDMGRFKAPTLRNIAVTAPYMHDGSIATLEEVIDHYAAGGRAIRSGEFKGDGSLNPNKSAFVKGFSLTAREKRDLIAFLKSLTDEKFLRDPRFSDPWKQPQATSQSDGRQERHRVIGILLSLYPDVKRVRVRHQAIEGVMGAMTMDYLIKDATELVALKPGDHIEAALVSDAETGEAWLEGFKVRKKAPARQAARRRKTF
jgi:cytochrome c peroxidase